MTFSAKEHNLSSPVIVGENAYLAAKVKREGRHEIAYGYSFEKVCLYALSLGIGTVMLAASLSRSTFEQAMEENGLAGSFSFEDSGIKAPAETHYIVTYERNK